jgi:hypothetical protein
MTEQAPEIRSILDRLDRLERQNEQLHRQNQRLKWAWGALLVFTLTFGVACASRVSPPAPPAVAAATEGQPAKVVEAEKFVLKDSKGRERGLFTSSSDATALMLMDPKNPETVRAGLGVTHKGGPTITLYDGAGKERIRLTVVDLGPGLFLVKEDGKHAFGVVGGKEGTVLELAPPSGNSLIELAVSPDIQRLVFTRDRKLRAGMVVTPDGPGLDLMDNEGKSVFSKP